MNDKELIAAVFLVADKLSEIANTLEHIEAHIQKVATAIEDAGDEISFALEQ